MLTDTAEVRGALEFAVQIVGPGMVLAAQRALDFHFLVHEDHAAMTADVVEDANFILLVTQYHQRQAHEFDRLDVTLFRQIAGEPETGPAGCEYLLAFAREKVVAGVGLVRQSGCRFDWLQNPVQLQFPGVFAAHFVYLKSRPHRTGADLDV